ncbi:YndM family protein [Metabacillus herbersteinensis]|uniref:YndM family protein n=1 Tax=Metabacillus herbersteinensis TaxID=283816 RepID=A0ABV6GDB5_9BACI
MKHLWAMVIKFIACFALLFVILGIGFDLSFQNVLLITFILGAVSYVLGDLFILPRTNNTIATIADLGLAFVVIWFILANVSDNGASIFWASLIASVGVALFEYFFHKYMVTSVLNKNEPTERKGNNSLQYQTEASEEVSPRIPVIPRRPKNKK